MNNLLKEKVAIITGSSRGIGQKVAQQLARLSIVTVINYQKNKDEAQKVVEEIIQNGGKAIAIQADIS